MTKGGKREVAGRPIGTTASITRKQRQFRLTDEEYEVVKEFVNNLKVGKK